MRPSALFVSGINADHMPAGLHEDRARLHGLPPPSIEAVREAADPQPPSRAAADQSGWPTCCDDGRPYLLGDGPASPISPPITSSGSISGRHIDCRAELAPYPRLLAWRDRMAAIGHGRAPTSIPTRRWPWPRHAAPAPPRPSQPQEGDPEPGERARVRPADNASDWIEGEVLFIDADEIALLRTDPEVGEVAVHFPRLGYDWRRAR